MFSRLSAGENVVAVEYAAQYAAPLQLALKGDGQRALARAAKPGHPEHQPALAQQGLFVGAGEHLVEYGVDVFHVVCLGLSHAAGANGQMSGMRLTDTTITIMSMGSPIFTKSVNL